MKKFLIILLSVVILLALVVGFGWRMLPTFISKKLSDNMGVKVEILAISNPFSDISVQEITVGNPSNSILEKALHVGSLSTDIKTLNLLNKHIVIDHMQLDDIYLGLEFASKTNPKGNWTTIVDNLQNNNTSTKKGEGSTKSVLIKTLVLTDVKIDLVYKSNPRRIIHVRPIKRVVIHNVGSDGAALIEQITQIVIREMLREIFSIRGLSNMIDSILAPKGGPQQWLNPLRILPGN